MQPPKNATKAVKEVREEEMGRLDKEVREEEMERQDTNFRKFFEHRLREDIEDLLELKDDYIQTSLKLQKKADDINRQRDKVLYQGEILKTLGDSNLLGPEKIHSTKTGKSFDQDVNASAQNSGEKYSKKYSSIDSILSLFSIM